MGEWWECGSGGVDFRCYITHVGSVVAPIVLLLGKHVYS